jgi:hypothetical protein
LQQRTASGWRTIYEGSDTASTLTGLGDGRYEFRLRHVRGVTGDAGWSAPLLIEIQHHSLARALGFFAMGAAMFLVLLWILAAKPDDGDQAV